MVKSKQFFEHVRLAFYNAAFSVVFFQFLVN